MIKIGLIGCGFMGTMHANCYKNIKDAEVVAFADIREDKARALAKGTNALIYSDGADLIDNADVDVIDICLPTYLHSKYALMAMDKVKYLFIEKPAALTNDETSQMLAKAKDMGCNVQVGQVIRFWDEYVKLKEFVDSGRVGKVISANFRRISPTPTWGWNDWLHDVKLSGGAAQDLHIHDIDYVLYLFGKPNTLKSIKNRVGEDNSYICSLMGYDDFAVTVEATWSLPKSHPFEATFRVAFEKGVVENDGENLMLYTDGGLEKIETENSEAEGDGFKEGNISDLGGYYEELVYFVDCARDGKRIEKATLESAAASLEFVLNEIKNA